MILKKVLLRWYRSFNINNRGYSDGRADDRPWNGTGDFPFVEIPIDRAITTIAGPNESGKSHLLAAIEKVLRETDSDGNSFSVSDLCHYCTKRDVNTNIWPNIGLQFGNCDDPAQLEKQLKNGGIEVAALTSDSTLTFLMPGASEKRESGQAAQLFVSGSPQSIALSEEQLTTARSILPFLEVLNSDLELPDHIGLGELLGAYNGDETEPDLHFAYAESQAILRQLHGLAQDMPTERGNLSDQTYKSLRKLIHGISKVTLGETKDTRLAVLLFREIIGVSAASIRDIINKGQSDRGYVETQVTVWNQRIEDELNLRRYWQQDESFRLLLNLKNGMIFFEIEDRTNSKYTFEERSSGLRFFLSYLIQAKALEKSKRTRHCIAIMDEPDCFLSILGQRNLLELFESLVSEQSSGCTCQLVYTTHSPFLINRNHPHRIRLLDKGDDDEGTQLVRDSASKRYEPVRSALGVECGQTLFVGAVNVIFEGVADQHLLAEAIRAFCTPKNVDQFLDLNRVTFVSGEDAESIATVVVGSQGGDLIPPGFVVLLDSDQGGDDISRHLLHRRDVSPVVDQRFVLRIGDLVKGTDPEPIVTTEDIVPVPLYAAAVSRHLKQWDADPKLNYDTVKQYLKERRSDGLVKATTQLFREQVYSKGKDQEGQNKRKYDKFGVLNSLFDIINQDRHSEGVSDFRSNVLTLCAALNEHLGLAQRSRRKESRQSTVRRLIKEFGRDNPVAFLVSDVRRLLSQLQKEADTGLSEDEVLAANIAKLRTLLTTEEGKGARRLDRERWNRLLRYLRDNAFEPLPDDLNDLRSSPKELATSPADSANPRVPSPK